MKTFRILIADDHEAVRRGIRALLEADGPWEVADEAKDGIEAVAKARRSKPDLVLLDLTMPVMNGLDAAREIRRALPNTHIVILTIHETGQLIEEAGRAGAVAVVSKAAAHDELIHTIASLAAASEPVCLADSVIGRRHIGAFFSSADERYRVLGPFIADGLARNEKALHLIDPPDRKEHVRRLMEMAIDVDHAEARGQLEMVPWEQAYLIDGCFDQYRMLRTVRNRLAEAPQRGYTLTRLIAHMEWALLDRPGVHELVEYEARFNLDVAESRDIVVCAYDLNRFPADIIVDLMRTHPTLLIDGTLSENDFYAPPEQMFEEQWRLNEARFAAPHRS